MPIYYIETEFGCGLRLARDIRQAKSQLRKEAGEFAQRCRKATEMDIMWVKQMGGYVPKETKKGELGR